MSLNILDEIAHTLDFIYCELVVDVLTSLTQKFLTKNQLAGDREGIMKERACFGIS